MKSYVAYLRVSTQKQGQSGLGLAAQRAAVAAFAPGAQVLAELVEVESGKQNRRPQLAAAMALAKAQGATLLIAKLDRLSRNAGFIFALRDAGVDFVCCDMPDANTLTVGIFAVLAQHERELISQRTKAALTAKKAQGARLGTPANLTPAATQKGRDQNRANARANEHNERAAAHILLLKEKGFNYSQIAAKLNALRFMTRTGKAFRAEQVKRLYRRTTAPAPALGRVLPAAGTA
ncbi:recombinase family protein [Hymenobacter coccineus]|uniref:Resolvase n=1 Tax=Hymenobacter coccineus TaxID=1908235 RepID=A0A1G1SUC0_9BACT|nr:recombinase family protein [Hymenobacter coccineus]OGX82201.1 resolvase [Hymenobacter coccineus]